MQAENLIQVNHDQCTKCGLCVKVCRGTLDMGEHGPEVVDNFCIACGHCVAICPNGALDYRLAPLDKHILLEKASTLDAIQRLSSSACGDRFGLSKKSAYHAKPSGSFLILPVSCQRPAIHREYLTMLWMIRAP